MLRLRADLFVLAGVSVAIIALVSFSGPRGWLLQPLSGAAEHRLPMWAAWHGRLMVAAWAVLIPLGTLAARYFKIWPGQDWPQHLDTPHWWNAHRALQSAGVVAATIALALVWGHAEGASGTARLHAILGWIILPLGWLQVLGGLLRGSKGGPTDRRARSPAFHGDHFAMTRRRIVFEWAHKGGGYAALGLSLVVVPLGLIVADAPRWMVVVIIAWWILLGWIAIRLQRAGRCVDTYEAIWGCAPDLPGQRLRPTGWGVSRAAQRDRTKRS